MGLHIGPCYLFARFVFCNVCQVYLMLPGDFLRHWRCPDTWVCLARCLLLGQITRLTACLLALAALHKGDDISMMKWRTGPSLYDFRQFNAMPCGFTLGGRCAGNRQGGSIRRIRRSC